MIFIKNENPAVREQQGKWRELIRRIEERKLKNGRNLLWQSRRFRRGLDSGVRRRIENRVRLVGRNAARKPAGAPHFDKEHLLVCGKLETIHGREDQLYQSCPLVRFGFAVAAEVAEKRYALETNSCRNVLRSLPALALARDSRLFRALEQIAHAGGELAKVAIFLHVIQNAFQMVKPRPLEHH